MHVGQLQPRTRAVRGGSFVIVDRHVAQDTAAIHEQSPISTEPRARCLILLFPNDGEEKLNMGPLPRRRDKPMYLVYDDHVRDTDDSVPTDDTTPQHHCKMEQQSDHSLLY